LDRTLVENVSWTVNDIKKNFGIEKWTKKLKKSCIKLMISTF
jgi:hypothetical protein